MYFRPKQGCLFIVSILESSPVGLYYYSLVLPSVLLTAMEDFTIDFLADVTYDTVTRLKRQLAIPLTGILQYDNIHDTTYCMMFTACRAHTLYVHLA
jgi:hypothetical protein